MFFGLHFYIRWTFLCGRNFRNFLIPLGEEKRSRRNTWFFFSIGSQRVKIRFENKMLGTVLDRFGRSAVVYTKEDEKHFVLTADVKVSEQFYGWLLGFGRKAQLIYPATAVENFKAYLNTVMGLYESC